MAGKTTVVKLITRLYDPTEGQILLEGIDLREYSLEDLHRNIGVIFQDFVRFEMTAKENIAIGRVDKPHTETELASAAHKSLADTVIDKLSGGYDQMLGRRFEGGGRAFRWRVAEDRAWRRAICAMQSCLYWTSRRRRWMHAASWRSLSDSLS